MLHMSRLMHGTLVLMITWKLLSFIFKVHLMDFLAVAVVAAALYLAAVKEHDGCFIFLRTDCGSENARMVGLHWFLTKISPDPGRVCLTQANT